VVAKQTFRRLKRDRLSLTFAPLLPKMAFDQKIEADLVPEGEMNLLVSLVKAPVMGILWIFGGRLNDDISLEKDRDPALVPRGSIPMRSTAYALPGCEDTESSGDSDGECHPKPTRRLRRANASGRTMSWSDESGQSLIEVFDLDGPTRAPSLVPPPTKSAIRRSSSLRPAPSPEETNETGTLPPAVSLKGGHVSPQWGWYISTTPPTPEMYGDRNHKPTGAAGCPGESSTVSQATLSQFATSLPSTAREGAATSGGGASQRQILPLPPTTELRPNKPTFTSGMKGGAAAKHIAGWPSVPL